MNEGKNKTKANEKNLSEMSMILEEIFQVQNEFSLMDGNAYLSLQKKTTTTKNTPRNELTMGQTSDTYHCKYTTN